MPVLVKSYDLTINVLDLCAQFQNEPHLFCLGSGQYNYDRGRYSFIGFDPFEIFEASGKNTLALLKDKYGQYGEPKSQALTPFASGIVGYLGYDYGLYQENIPLKAKGGLGLPDAFWGFYDCVLTVDHHVRKLHITSSGWPEKNKLLREKRAAERLKYVEQKVAEICSCAISGKPFAGTLVQPRRGWTTLGRSPSLVPTETSGHRGRSGFLTSSKWLPETVKEQYLSAVRKVLHHIAQGDIYQLNLSQRFTCDVGKHINSFDMYRSLCELSPVSFGGYLDAGCAQLISNSPEMFLRLRDGKVQTRPMKGTRPRRELELEDRQFRKEIEQSEKDKAELLMITDLERNDLGKVCDYGSIKVEEMRTIEEYKYVYQATSSVNGVLQKNKDCFDLVEACFPGGSITGCPKIRAMEIIEELEPTRRGPYTGSMGYIDFSGDMDLNILIRTMLRVKEKVYFQVGGGIVADSTPEGEYEETLVKAKILDLYLKKQTEEKVASSL